MIYFQIEKLFFQIVLTYTTLWLYSIFKIIEIKMNTDSEKKYWKHHTKLHYNQIEWFDKNTVEFHLDIKSKEIYQLFDDAEKKIIKEGSEKSKHQLESKDIIVNQLIDKTSSIKSTLKYILNQNWYDSIKSKSSSKSYFQQEKDLVIRLRDLLNTEIDELDINIEKNLSNNVINKDLLDQRKFLKEQRNKLTNFAAVLKEYIRWV